MRNKRKKIFVLDTNVILHDSSCIYQFEENDVVIPVTVLEELDQFKKGKEELNYHAREFTRALDLLSGDSMFTAGVQIGAGLGRISIKLEREFHADLRLNFSREKPDHHILNIAYRIFKEQKTKQVILVSKDVNLRMKAKSVGLCAQDYRSDQVKDVMSLYSGREVIENVSSELIDRFHQPPYEADATSLSPRLELTPNQYFILRNRQQSVLVTYNALRQKLIRVDKPNAYGIAPRNAEQTFALNALLNNDIQLVSLSGKAGTGKTLLALAAALERRKSFRQIFVARPVVPLSNKDIGYLPGDIQSKLNPYMQPLFDNLGIIQHQYTEVDSKASTVSKFIEEEKLVVEPLTYIRGRSLVKVFFIVDEAQNLTPHEVKTIITRAGEGTKVVFTGDIFQIDHPYLDSSSNGMSYLIEKMKGQSIYAHVNLEKGERSKLAELASNLL
ncbi:MAG TPA: PhoH family protein [Bacteroidota bacterium]|nr:PhoH family protein [Bacteroidota bacterium]